MLLMLAVAPVFGQVPVETKSMALALLFKLDRFNGTVWQSVMDTEGTTGWEELPVEVRSPKNDATPHYQIFMSSHVARHSFLLDTATGKTWVYVAQTEGPALWVPVPQFDTTPQVTFWRDLDAPAAKRKTAK